MDSKLPIKVFWGFQNPDLSFDEFAPQRRAFVDSRDVNL